MKDWQSLAHVKWECKYHVVILPKYRRNMGLRRLALAKEQMRSDPGCCRLC